MKEIEEYVPPHKTNRLRHISSMMNAIINIYKKDKTEVLGFPTKRWKTFNEAFGGARPGEVITLTGETGVGKSTVALNWLMDTAEQARPCFLISLELRWKYIAKKFSQMVQQKEIEYFEDRDICELNEKMSGLPIWFLDYNGVLRDQLLLQAITYAALEKGCRFVVLDHLDYVEKTGWGVKNESYIIGDFLRALCSKAHELEITILLICHPRKLDTKGYQSREIGADELKGSSSIKQESDAVFSLYQPNGETTETIVRFLKIRADGFSKNRLGFIRFKFEPTDLRLYELSRAVEFGDV